MLPSSVYENFREILSRDVAPRRAGAQPPVARKTHSAEQAVARRLGLSTLPLCCVVLRMLWVNTPHTTLTGGALLLAFACTLALKTLMSMCITAYACGHLERCEGTELVQSRDSSPRHATRTPKEQRQHLAHVQTLQQIQRYTLFKSRVPT